ncbi:MAG: MetQ/NlpA family ABC transporter substrate-binding protein [Deltaproteobacteria bacterium]|nr:MetQ/NlpA family ABC transporter substrate-binding protein [Deltaproteobacteria bacterium]
MTRTAFLFTLLALPLLACQSAPPPAEAPKSDVAANPLTGRTGVKVEPGQTVLAKPLRVGASKIPHAELIKAVMPELAAIGVTIDLKTYEDYGLPNMDVAKGNLDANFFQTEPYLWRWRAAHGEPLVVVGRVHIEPMGLYSKKLTKADLAGLKPGLTVAVPGDAANLGRALFVLQRAGLITLDPLRGLDAGVEDIKVNAHALKILPLADSRQLRSMAADLVVLNGNLALEDKLDPSQALAIEDGSSPFPNVVVTRQESATDSRVLALVKALRGPTAQKLLKEKYGGLAIPAVESPSAAALQEK